VHAVEEALRAGRPIRQIVVARGARPERLGAILAAARERGVAVRREPRQALDRLAGGGAHQGVVALSSSQSYASLDGIIRAAAEDAALVLLDGVEDPHNLGAIIRSAYAAGAAAVVIPERRAAGLTGTVAKASAGALEHLPVVQVKNLNRAIDELKRENFWIYGLDERGEQSYDEAEYSGRVALVLGAEGKGLHRATAERCDFRIRIPVAGAIASLNVSVAAGVVLFELLRQRRRSKEPEAANHRA